MVFSDFAFFFPEGKGNGHRVHIGASLRISHAEEHVVGPGIVFLDGDRFKYGNAANGFCLSCKPSGSGQIRREDLLFQLLPDCPVEDVLPDRYLHMGYFHSLFFQQDLFRRFLESEPEIVVEAHGQDIGFGADFRERISAEYLFGQITLIS